MNSIPVVTKNILIINVLCFFGSVVAAKYGIDLNDLLGLHFFLASDFNPAQLITYMFMHAGFQHIFFNMFAVWMFGRTLEQVWGPKRFLFYYILCGIGAGLVQEGVQYIQYVTELANYEGVNTGVAVIPMAEYLNLMTTVGASGAVYAILLAFGMCFIAFCQRIYCQQYLFALRKVHISDHFSAVYGADQHCRFACICHSVLFSSIYIG